MPIPADSLSYPCLATIQHFAIPEERQGEVYEYGQRLRESLIRDGGIPMEGWPARMRFKEMSHLERLYMEVAERFNWRPTCP